MYAWGLDNSKELYEGGGGGGGRGGGGFRQDGWVQEGA